MGQSSRLLQRVPTRSALAQDVPNIDQHIEAAFLARATNNANVDNAYFYGNISSNTNNDDSDAGEEYVAHDASDGDNDEEDDDTRLNDGSSLLVLTRRLRCLFSAITCPIVPLGTVVALAFVYMMYTAFCLDNAGATVFNENFWNMGSHRRTHQAPCSHPLHAYGWASLFLASYVPYHHEYRTIYSRGHQRDARRFDQIFYTVALLYVYAGITLVETCREDIVRNSEERGGEGLDLSSTNSCQATCPTLTDAMTVYVATLELFTLSLILPLLFLPCIYIWFLRQATQDQEAMALLQQQLREDSDTDDLLFGAMTRRRNITNAEGSQSTMEDILQNMESVKLVAQDESQREKYLFVSAEDSRSEAVKTGSRECCICMTDFNVSENDAEIDMDLESGRPAPIAEENEIVRTSVCGHIFHRHCIASWVGGRWERRRQTNTHGPWSLRSGSTSRRYRDGGSNNASANGNAHASNVVVADAGASLPNRDRQRHAIRTTCPLCRADLSQRTARYGTF
jgi:hypothetical protein